MPPGVDGAIAALAGGQHGIVDRVDLHELGVANGAIARRVATARLHRLYDDVFAVGHTGLSPRGRLLAAVRACGRAAVLSHRDAAALHGLRDSARSRVDVTIPRGGRRAPPGVDLHRTRALDPVDVEVVDGIPVTTVPRTLVELAGVLGERRLRQVVHRADVLRVLDAGAVRAAADRLGGRRGLGTLRRLVGAEHAPTASELEERFLELCLRAGFPAPQVNVPVGEFVVDFCWPDARLIVETDGAAVHGTRRAFEDDRARDVALTVAGWTVVRFTWRQIAQEPERVVAALRRLLDRPR